MSNLKGTYFRVLDQGYIGLVDVMGDDAAVEQAARTSYGKGTRKVSDTNNLLRYLMRHRHSTPFEMGELKFHVKVPMDCWRQWIRHRTASVNEYSTRYSEAIDDNQITMPHQWRSQAKNNKQGSGDFLTEYDGIHCTELEQKCHYTTKSAYEEMVELGVAKEQARKVLPLDTYTMAYWKTDLKNLLGFMSLRCDSHAQKEIRDFANVIAGFVKELFPLTFQAWYDYHFMSVSFSRLEMKLLHQYVLILMERGSVDETVSGEIKSETQDFALNKLNMSKREVKEFWDKTLITKTDSSNFDLDYSKVIDMEEENAKVQKKASSN